MLTLVRSPGSAIKVFTSSERLANQLKKNEMDDPTVEKNEEVGTLATKIGKLVKRNEMDVPRVEKVLDQLENWWRGSRWVVHKQEN